MKVSREKRAAPKLAASRWMHLAGAAFWVVYGRERPERDMGGPLLAEWGSLFEPLGPIEERLLLLREALERGRLKAFGLRDFNEAATEILPAAWVVRIIATGADGFISEPYKSIVVERSAVMKLWPANAAVRRRGRPSEIDWERVRVEAEKYAQTTSLNALAESLRSWYRDEVEPNRPLRDLRAFQRHLATWGLQPEK